VRAEESLAQLTATRSQNGQPPRDTWKLESAADIAARGVEPVSFDIETLLTKDDGPVLFFGAPGSLKTYLALHAAACTVTGDPFLGQFAVCKRPVAIYVNFDAGARAFRRRVVKVAPRVRSLYVTSPDGYDASALRETIEQYPKAFVVVDCLSDCYQSQRGEDQGETMRRFLRELRGLYHQHDCNGIIIDHPRRAREGEAHGDYYGSVQKEAAARMMWQAMRLPSDDPSTPRVKVICKKMSEAEPFAPFLAKVTFSADRVSFAYDGKVDEVTGVVFERTADHVLLERVLVGVTGGMSRKALQLRLGWGADRVRTATKDSARVITIGTGKNTHYGLASEQTEMRPNSSVAPDEPNDEPEMRPFGSSVFVGAPKSGPTNTDESADESEAPDSSVPIDERADEAETVPEDRV